MLTLLVIAAIGLYGAMGVRTAGWVKREDEVSPDIYQSGVGFIIMTGVCWPLVQVARLSVWLGRQAYRLLAPPLRALYLSGYSRPGDKEKALLEADNAADAELAQAEAEADLEKRLNQ